MTESKKKLAYDTKYESTPEQIKKRSARNSARRIVEKKVGNLPANVDVDHKIMLKDGGTNAPSNLRPRTVAKNRGWRKGMKGYG